MTDAPFFQFTKCTYNTYTFDMPMFIELPAFGRHRHHYHYLSDEQFRQLQMQLLENPEHGDLMVGTGGLRKLRFGDERQGKGKRGGL